MSGTAGGRRVVTLLRVALICLLLGLTFTSGVEPARAACVISGLTYRDYNDNGLHELLEPGQGGVTITAFNQAGGVDATTSDIDGNYTLTLGADGEVRLEFTWDESFLYSARFAGASSRTTVTFVDCNGTVDDINMGLSLPSQYCHIADPELGTSCYIFEDPVMGPFADGVAFVAFPSNAGVNADRVGERQLAIASQIGTTWGLGYHRTSDSFFVAAYLKRHAGTGPGGTGAIYRIRPSTGQVSLFYSFTDAGTDPHPANVNDCPPNAYNNCWQYDTDTYNLVGKLSMGDLDISEDDKSIFVVNLFTRELIQIPIGYDAVVPPAGQMRRYSLVGLPGVTCPAADQRPFGLGTHDGRVYIGSVCSAESSQNAANLRAYVHSFDPLDGGGFRQEINFALNYPRACADQGDINCPVTPGNDRTAPWQPWTPVWPPPDGGAQVYPEPLLTDIVFDNQDMILGFRDRFGDRTGYEQPGPFDLASFALMNGITAGDILRVCRDLTTNTWELENNGTCGGVTTAGAGTNEGPGGGEFYFHDRNNPIIPAQGQRRHDEISLGGLVDIPGSGEVAMTAFDPLCENGCGATNPLYDAGVVWLSNDTGERVRSYRIFDGGQSPAADFGKANGLGDLEAVCGPAPLEIGNRIWEDLDRNGRQDPGEVKLGGVIVNLYMDTTGDGRPDTHVAQTTTNADGEYYFNESNVFFAGLVAPTPGINYRDINGNSVRDDFEPAGLMPNTVYEVRLDDPANYGGGPLTDYYATLVNTVTRGDGNDDSRDSDGIAPSPRVLVSATNFPVARLTTRLYGDNDHTYDFGFSRLPPPQITPTVPVTPPSGLTISKEPEPPFAQPGQEVNWTIRVTNTGSTVMTNVVVEDRLPDELEILSVPPNATVSGQLVRITFDVIQPGQTVTAVIRTRVRPGVGVPFVIVNTATILGGPSTSAQLVSVERLPETGETPLIRWLILAAGGLAVLGAGVFLARRRLGRA